MIALFILAPAAVMMLFASIIVPMFFTGKGMHFSLAIYQEDNSLEVNSFVSNIIRGKAIAELTRITEVAALPDGLKMVENQEVSVLLHIPANVKEHLSRHETVTIKIYSTPSHALEQSLITMTLGQALLTVGQSQNQLQGARTMILDLGGDPARIDEYISRVTLAAIVEYMGRRQVLGENGTISPLGDFLPVEYYLAAVFAMFAALAMLPLVHYTATDLNGSIFHRGLAAGNGFLPFCLARLAAGTLFILMVLLMIFPTSLLLGLTDNLMGSLYNASLPALVGAALLGALSLSGLALALGVWIRKPQPAVWTGFFLILGMSVAAGALIPDGLLPSWLAAIGRWLPVRALMRSLSLAMFDFRPDLFAADALKLAGLSLLAAAAAVGGFAREERGR